MKRKFLGGALALTLLFTGVITLSACGGEVRHYYTLAEEPEHCSVNVWIDYYDNDGRHYLLEEQEFKITVNVDYGYYSDNFKILIDGNEVETTPSYSSNGDYISSYEYSFMPQSDFAVSYSGDFKIMTKTISFKAVDYFVPQDDIFVRFEQNRFSLPTTNIKLSSFSSAIQGWSRQLSYGEVLTFYAVTKGYDRRKMPSVFACEGTEIKAEFYKDESNNEFGLRYIYTQGLKDVNIEIGNGGTVSNTIVVNESDAYGNNLTSSKIDLTLDEISEETFTITLKNCEQIPNEVLSALEFKINDVKQDVDFTSAIEKNGVFTFELKNPYEYASDLQSDAWLAYKYVFDLNFYTLEYFDGLEFSIVTD